MKFLTWNVDGLCGEATYDRTHQSLKIILSQAPDLLFLQEVIPTTETIFSAGLKSKGYISATPPPPGASYFTMCYYNPVTVTPPEEGGVRLQYHGEARSRMGRDILQLRCQYHSPQEKNAQSAVSSSPPILALSSHLESTKASSEVRIAQLVQMAQLVYDLGRTGVALIAGDLNMRDKEAKDAVLAIRERNGDDSFDLNDAYFHFGKPKSLSKTWIMPGKPMVGSRFDRIYHSCHLNTSTDANTNQHIEFQSLQHVGTKIIPAVGMTPSDHFGLMLVLKFGSPVHLAGLVVGQVTAKLMNKRGIKRKAGGYAEETTSSVASIASTSSLNSSSANNASATNSTSQFSQRIVTPFHSDIINISDFNNIGHINKNGDNVADADNEDEEDDEDDDDDEDLKLALKLSMEQIHPSEFKSLVSTFHHPLFHQFTSEKEGARALTSNMSETSTLSAPGASRGGSSSNSSSSSGESGRRSGGGENGTTFSGAAVMTEKERRRAGFLKALESRSLSLGGSSLGHASIVASPPTATSATTTALDVHSSRGPEKSKNNHRRNKKSTTGYSSLSDDNSRGSSNKKNAGKNNIVEIIELSD